MQRAKKRVETQTRRAGKCLGSPLLSPFPSHWLDVDAEEGFLVAGVGGKEVAGAGGGDGAAAARGIGLRTEEGAYKGNPQLDAVGAGYRIGWRGGVRGWDGDGSDRRIGGSR